MNNVEEYLKKWPNLFIVGAPKAATTSIANLLSTHPDIFLSKKKEPNYFIFENDQCAPGFHYRGVAAISDEKEYLKMFEGKETFKYRCDASTSYLQYTNAAENIKRKVPDAKIIIILRNPIERAFSHYHYHRMINAEPIETFEKALAAEEKRKKNNFWKHYLYVDTGMYFEQVSKYIDLFGKESVLVLFYEELFDRPSFFYSRIFNFLNIKPVESMNYKTISNRGMKVVSDSYVLNAFKYLENRIFFKKTLKKLLPLKIAKLQDLKSRIYNRFFGAEMSVITRKKLIQEFKSDIERLEALLKVDLSHWLK